MSTPEVEEEEGETSYLGMKADNVNQWREGGEVGNLRERERKCYLSGIFTICSTKEGAANDKSQGNKTREER